MRAIYRLDLENLKVGDSFELDDADFHHLVRVARVRDSDQIKVILGQGESYLAQVQNIDKKYISLKKISKTVKEDRLHHISLAIGINRPDTFKNLIQMSCELGIKKIFIIHTDHSSHKLIPLEKIKALLKSGVEQSNSAYVPEVIILDSIKNLIELDQPITCFINGLKEGSYSKAIERSRAQDNIMLIGPEGGFSPLEIDLLLSCGSMRKACLDTPIMRTETAVATCFGFLLQSNED